jgi:hypothetical protein
MNVYLRFGRPLVVRDIDQRKRVAQFAPGSVFCRIWSQSNEDGNTRWELSVLETIGPGESAQRVVGIAPGAKLLLHVDTPRGRRSVLNLIESIEEQGIDATQVARTYWQTVHGRLAARCEPVRYSGEQHHAYLACRELR